MLSSANRLRRTPCARPVNRREIEEMTSVATRIGLLAGLAMICFSGTASAASYACMTDDGYGRKRTCSADYKAANPNWRGTDACMTDDGYGRKRPCSADYKAKHKK